MNGCEHTFVNHVCTSCKYKPSFDFIEAEDVRQIVEAVGEIACEATAYVSERVDAAITWECEDGPSMWLGSNDQEIYLNYLQARRLFGHLLWSHILAINLYHAACCVKAEDRGRLRVLAEQFWWDPA